MNYLEHYLKIKDDVYNFTINHPRSIRNENSGFREFDGQYCGLRWPNISLVPYTLKTFIEILKCDSKYIFIVHFDQFEYITLIEWKPRPCDDNPPAYSKKEKKCKVM